MSSGCAIMLVIGHSLRGRADSLRRRRRCQALDLVRRWNRQS
jgi:hypothetical protein